MRIATYNVEWFANLFDRQDRLYNDGKWSGRHDVTRAAQTEALGKVFSAVDADVILVVEAPDTNKHHSSTRALEFFASHFGLRSRKAQTGFTSDTQQELSLLYDPDVVTVEHDPVGLANSGAGPLQAPRFDTVFRLDLDLDGKTETISFSKPPLEVAMTLNSGAEIRLIGVHAKSKAPHGARSLKDKIRISIANRRKQLAQCIWIRERVESHLLAGQSLIVLGDFNDGPGLDEYEKLFGQSSVEIVLGLDKVPDLQLFDPHARVTQTPRPVAAPSTSRFFLPHQGRFLNALLDFIMISADLHKRGAKWRIWHPFDDAECFADTDLRRALLVASDHFPVTVDLKI